MSRVRWTLILLAFALPFFVLASSSPYRLPPYLPVTIQFVIASFSSSTIEFVSSFRRKTKLIIDGYTYTFQKERNNGCVAWRRDLNNKAARDKGTACNTTAVTTSTSTSSFLEYPRNVLSYKCGGAGKKSGGTSFHSKYFNN